MVLEEFLQHGAIVEKYDVARRRANIDREILFGYRTNEAGFGWTNAVFTALFDGLTPVDRSRLEAVDAKYRSRREPVTTP
jgi:neutral trehalase